ncbi:DUF2380 domain-containing protein [Xanthobacteraceae bacterium Astr-EGSB]|uniref:DUF2380 domain-containing protein n=1 Tax=Astrobacterium formosum TaxID=3069710 RepID=UPI0027B513C4|nr:DUF2380 domain-containing protein [Xanthobacteraceae bacterium Astr-EGSB]
MVSSKWSRRRQTVRCSPAVLLACMLAALTAWAATAGAQAAGPVTVAVAEFDYVDTSGEPVDQTAAHRARVADFAAKVRQRLAEQGYEVRPLSCAEACTAATASPDGLAAAARKAGARLVVAGGIHKMSTLIQFGEVQLLDLDKNALLLRRTFSFRGDNDTAFRRAAAFVGETLTEAMPKS